MTDQHTNGLSLDRIAQLISGRFPIDATQDEHRVAEGVRKYGQRLEKEGYLPTLRRAAMQRKMTELCRPSPVLGAVKRLYERTEPKPAIDGVAKAKEAP